MKRSNNIRHLVHLCVLAALPPFAAAAEEVAPDDLEILDVAVVTGSRISRAPTDTPNPVMSFDSENIVQSGLTNLTELLVQSPALVGSTTRADTSGSNAGIGAAGLNLLDLRNLGTSRTLVLVNGRRHVGSLPGSASVDINTIPMDLIERVDVLTGGVSAIYGADGVSGVVNFVTKRNFQGVSVRGQVGMSEYGDAGSDFFSFTAGQNFAGGRGNVALAYEYGKDDKVRSFDRKNGGDPLRTWSIVRNPDDFPDDPAVYDRIPFNNLRYADTARNGAVDVDLDGVSDFTGDGDVFDGGLFLPESGFLTQGGSSTPVAGYGGDLQAGTQRHVANLLGSFDVSDSVRVFGELKFAETRTSNSSQPSYDFYNVVQGENPYMPQVIRDALDPDEPIAFLSRDNFDFGTRGDEVTRKTWRSVVGVEGRASEHVRYELSYTYGQSKIRAVDLNQRINERFFAALDAVDEGAYLTGTPNGNIRCRIDLDPAGSTIDPWNWDELPVTFTPGANSGCVPLNLFGEYRSDPAALAFINANPVTRSKLTQHVVSGSLSGDLGSFMELPGGPVAWAAGAEYRKEKSFSDPDQIIQDEVLWGYPMITTERGSFDVKEAFAEVNLPLLRDVTYARLLSVGAAVRMSDYSTVGKTSTWKVDTVWAPNDELTFRGTYSEAVRAPNISELFAPVSGTFEFIDDPCDPTNLAEGTSFRAANCNALLTGLGIDPATFSPSTDGQASASLPGRLGGNPDLQEETAKSWTAGFQLRPAFAPGFTMSLDWYDIKLKNAISTAEAQDVVDLCVDQPTLDNQYCASVSRNPATGFVNDFLVGPQNVAQYTTAGADLTLNYTFALNPDWGRFNFRVNGGYLDELTLIATPGAEIDDERMDTYAPKYIATGDLTWLKGGFVVNYGVNYFSKTRRYSEAQKAANPDLADPKYFWHKEKWVHDLRVAYDFAGTGLRLYGGVNNLYDAKPSFASTSYPTGFVGRYFYAGVNFDTNKR